MAGLFICDIRGECGDGVHYRTSSHAPVAVAHRDGLAELPRWLNADAPLDLSFTKLSTIGSALQMPFGALVRSVVPEAREDELIRYRTINIRESKRAGIFEIRLLLQGFHGSERRGSPFPCLPGAGQCLSSTGRRRRETARRRPSWRTGSDGCAPSPARSSMPKRLATYRSVGTRRKTGRGRTPVTEPPPRVGAGPTVHGNGRPPVVPDGPPRRYGGILQKCGVSERKSQRGGGDVVAAVRGKGIPASYGGGGMARRVEDVPRRRSALFCLPQ